MNDDFQLLSHYGQDYPEWGSAPRRPLININGAHQGELMDSVVGPDPVTREPMVYHILRCELCIITHVWPLPEPEALARYYADQFYQMDKTAYVVRYEEDRRWWEQCVHGPILQQCHDALTVSHPGPARFLEIGSGPGIALDVAKQRFGWETCGMEPNEDLCRDLRRRGHLFIHGTLENHVQFRAVWPKEESVWDILYLYEVLEHQPNPEAFLLDCYELLNPGGLIVICVPNDYNKLQLEACKKFNLPHWWVAGAVPQHLSFFTPKTLQLLVRRCGFRLLISRTTYPIEKFLLEGRNYVANDTIGRECHKQRIREELEDIKNGKWHEREQIYQENMIHRIGRELVFIAQKM